MCWENLSIFTGIRSWQGTVGKNPWIALYIWFHQQKTDHLCHIYNSLEMMKVQVRNPEFFPLSRYVVATHW
jgi:hypothetical protein